ncbi:MAG: M48 family metallopeptidase [Acholeplasmataceae bacterium]|nr:M48 family metallopeptidase [Acholeplasmataceae bacterium]
MIAYLVVGLIILMFTLDVIVSLLNYNYRNKPIPENVKDIYDKEQYQKWLNYTMDQMRFGLIKKVFDTLLMVGLLVFGFFGTLEGWTNGWFTSPTLRTLSFLGVILIGLSLINIPFSYYLTFVIEEKYGFNKTKKKTFFFDFVKNLLLMTVLVGAVIALFSFLYLQFSDSIWLFILFAWLALSVIIVLMFILNVKVFVKLFNKLSPLPEGELRTRIEAMAKEVGFEVKAISSMDASKRSTKLNAFFSGLGKTREVVLFDTLIEKLSDDEILSVLAHELGHAMHKDAPRMILERIIVFGLYAAIIGFIMQSISLATAFGLSGIHLGFGLILFTILIEPIDFILGVPLNYLSRKAEYAADAFSTKYVDKKHMMSALRILVTENYANLNPHPIYILLHYSHPAIPDRLGALEKL